MHEGALLCEYSRRHVIKDQLLYLADLVSDLADTVELRILPFSAPPGAIAGASPYALLDFDSPHLPTAVWEESIRPIGLSADEELADFYHWVHAQAESHTLSREDSLKAILNAAQRL